MNVALSAILTLVIPVFVNGQGVTVTSAQQGSVKSSAVPAGPMQRMVSITANSATLQRVLSDLAKQARTELTYSDAIIPANKRVTVNISNRTLSDALVIVLKGTGLVARPLSTGTGVVIAPCRNGEDVQKRGDGTITGRVIDAKAGRGIARANVSLESETRSVITGDDGTYRLANISSGVRAITVRLVGYAKQTRQITVGEGATVTADFKLEPSANVLDQVIVTGTVVQTELKAVPSAITVVTAKQIEERGITRIDQLFRGDIPGLFALNQGSAASLDEVTMFSRGATALTFQSAGVDPNTGNTNPIKTYVDGVELADARYLSQIDPSSIERIEILTGPQASTIYGSNAINGVMQIFTKRGVGSRPQLTLNLTSGITQNNFSSAVAPNHVADASVRVIEGKLSYNVGGSWNYIGAWTPGKQTQRSSVFGGSRMDVGRLTADVSARRGMTRNRQNGSLTHNESNLVATGVYRYSVVSAIPNPQTQTLNGRTVGLTLSYHLLPWWSHELNFGSDSDNAERLWTARRYSFQTDTTLDISGRTSARSSQRYNTTLQVPLSTVARLNLTVGGDRSRTSGSSWFASPTSLTGTLAGPSVTRDKRGKNTAVYAQGQLGFLDALFFTYGLRADWNPTIGDDARVLPGRYGVSYARDIGSISAKIRGSYGRSIRPPAPVFKDAFPAKAENLGTGVLALFGPFDETLANRNLAPEHQQGGEGGVELYFGSRASLVVTRYNQTVDNLISSVGRADSARSLVPVFPATSFCGSFFGVVSFDNEGHCFYYQSQNINVGSIRNQGWETQGSFTAGPLTTRGTYSWTKSRVIGITPRYRALLQSGNPAFEPGRPFDYIPEHTWALGFTYAQGPTSIGLSVNGTAQLYTASDDLSLSARTLSRLVNTRPRAATPSGYRALGGGYAMADLNATHRFSSQVDGLVHVVNLADQYHNDFSAQNATAGRQTRLGLRIRM